MCAFEFPKRIPLSQLPTPIEKLERLAPLFNGVEIYIKRDDLTGIDLSGNKIRKLEFIAAKALQQGIDTLITAGGQQSNHARATAAVAARLGLRAHLVLGGDGKGALTGNLLLDYLLGAEVTLVPTEDLDALTTVMQELANEYRKKGHQPEILPMGASNATGALGYAHAIAEMLPQFEGLGFIPDYIVAAAGSGGTHAGLMIGKELFKLPCEIISINVRMDAPYFVREISRVLDEFRNLYLSDLQACAQDIHIVDGYVGTGYAQSTLDELRFIHNVARTTGLVLDPVYTGKAFYALWRETQNGRFQKGNRILFIHTGGIYGLFPFGDQYAREVLGSKP
ncbi:MAG: D-cysteine desulfhydrase family protein [Anaerolineae bacterium]|nr:D-cysteine desulfhydrase family protein [Anaerolineae bacterium]